MDKLPLKFIKAIQKIKDLERHEYYTNAFIFGSAARGKVTSDSDLDAIVITENPSLCSNINHPIINGIKLDITFTSIGKLRHQTEKEKQSGRIPMLAESKILFDKNGSLKDLKRTLNTHSVPRYSTVDHQDIQFQVFHLNNKAERNLKKDPHSALLTMGIGINDLLKFSYKMNGKWWVSSKRLIGDIGEWDPKLAKLVKKFLVTNRVQAKFVVWSKIIDHVLKPIGGRKKIEEINCNCKDCTKNLELLLA